MTTATLSPIIMSANSPDPLTARIKATWVAGDFGKIAASYAAGAAEFIKRLNFQPGETVLDLACGTGNLAIPAARRGATVTGIDIAPNLIEQAKVNARIAGLTIHFEEGDAEQMPYANDSFDTVVTMFGVMFVARPEAAASELVRVTRPGGRIAMANWTPDGFIGQMFKIVAKHAPPAPGIPSPLTWGNAATVAERLGSQIATLQSTQRTITFNFPFGAKETVDYFRSWYGPTVKAFGSLDPMKQVALQNELEQHWAQHNQADNGWTQVDSTYLEVVAVRK